MTKIIGIDEVGLGAWAGPLVVCAYAAPSEKWTCPGLNDSKKLTRESRERVAKPLMRDENSYALVQVEAPDIDKYGIAKVLADAMVRALDNLVDKVGTPDRVIIDGENKGILGAEYYPKADGSYPCVMAASVIAKVYRDELMIKYALEYPVYGFERHVGYGTPMHSSALMSVGVCPLHRKSYEPIRTYMKKGKKV